MDASQQWGLPPEFAPVRYAIPDAAKEIARGLLRPNEPVIISIGNEGDTIALLATPQRVLVIKTAQMGAGASGANVRDYPWDAIFDIVKRPQTYNLTLAIHFRSNDGKKIEVGRRAMLAKPAVENIMAFESAGGDEVYKALLQVWNWKKLQAQNAPAPTLDDVIKTLD